MEIIKVRIQLRPVYETHGCCILAKCCILYLPSSARELFCGLNGEELVVQQVCPSGKLRCTKDRTVNGDCSYPGEDIMDFYSSVSCWSNREFAF